MGKMKVGEKVVVAPASELSAAEVKKLGGVSNEAKLYDAEGNLLDDDEIVSTEETTYGVVTGWRRG